MFQERIDKLRKKLIDKNIDLALITDDDNIYYFTGYYDYLHMDFGRPTILLVTKNDESILITPLIDIKLVEDDAVIDKVFPWNDGVGSEWKEHLPGYLTKDKTTIVIAHRLSTILNSKKIFVIDNGKIISEGTHDELLKISPVYKNFYEKQITKN